MKAQLRPENNKLGNAKVNFQKNQELKLLLNKWYPILNYR